MINSVTKQHNLRGFLVRCAKLAKISHDESYSPLQSLTLENILQYKPDDRARWILEVTTTTTFYNSFYDLDGKA